MHRADSWNTFHGAACSVLLLQPVKTVVSGTMCIGSKKAVCSKDLKIYHEITETVDTYMSKVPNIIHIFLSLLTGRKNTAKPT